GEVFWLTILGDLYYNLKQHEQAIDCYQQILNFAQFENIRFIGSGNLVCMNNEQKKLYGYGIELNILRRLSSIYQKLGQEEKALECSKQALDIACKRGDKEEEC